MSNPTKAMYSIAEIEPLDDMILVQVPEPIKQVGRIHVTDQASKELSEKLSYKVLKVGSAWEVMYPKESGSTPIKVGDDVIIGGQIQALTLTDFPYTNNAALVYRSDIKCKLNIKTESKIIN